MEKVRRIQIDAILFPFTFWSDLKKKASHTHSANALSLSYQQARVEELTDVQHKVKVTPITLKQGVAKNKFHFHFKPTHVFFAMSHQ